MNSSANSFSVQEQQVLAFSGIVQSAALVQELAKNGSTQDTETAALINSLLVLNPDTIADVYPNVSHLNQGLRMLQHILGNQHVRQHADVVRYILGMLVLGNKVTGNNVVQEKLRCALQAVSPLETAAESNGDEAAMIALELCSERTFEQLGKIYQDTISTLSYRIQVRGKAEQLQKNLIAGRIRALLLAGIRSAVLWYQLGGRRWHLVFYRKRMLESATAIRRKLLVTV